MATVTLKVRVKPRGKISELAPQLDGTWIAKLKSPPVDGKANEELIGLLAKHFSCRRSEISIKSGATGRVKLVTLDL